MSFILGIIACNRGEVGLIPEACTEIPVGINDISKAVHAEEFSIEGRIGDPKLIVFHIVLAVELETPGYLSPVDEILCADAPGQ